MIENDVATAKFIFKGGNTVINLLSNMKFTQTLTGLDYLLPNGIKLLGLDWLQTLLVFVFFH